MLANSLLPSIMMTAVFLAAESGSAQNGSPEKPLVWNVAHATEPPAVDGQAEAFWEKAAALTVTVRKSLRPDQSRSVRLRALHCRDAIYVLAQWPDATRSDMRDPYVWNNAKQAYERTKKPDDQFALEFPLRGDFDVNMLAAGRDYAADVWHWKAGRGNPVGWVDDKTHVISTTPTPKAQEYKLGQRAVVYIARLMDAGTAAYREVPPPTAFQADTVDSYEPCEPAGSLADVRGKGVHDGRGWTLEMARRLNTGHDDDAVLDRTRAVPCAIAILDDELYWEHYVSPPITLHFSPEGR
jgi:hypothetical protein